MTERLFTPETANRALVLVRPIAEEMVERYAAIAGLVAEGAGEERLRDATAAVWESVHELSEIGLEVKDVGGGLLDFPALHDGAPVLLCWRVGELEVAFWHGPADGFAGRRRLPF